MLLFFLLCCYFYCFLDFMMFSSNLLSSLVWMPIGFGILHIIFNSYKLSESLAKIFSLAFNIPLIYLGILLYQQFDSNNPAFQLTERFAWMPFLDHNPTKTTTPFWMLPTVSWLPVVTSAWRSLPRRSLSPKSG